MPYHTDIRGGQSSFNIVHLDSFSTCQDSAISHEFKLDIG